MRVSILVLLLILSQLTMGQSTENNMTKLTDLEGRWYVNHSNFPMWLKGDKSSPTYNYNIKHRKTDTVLIDKVAFIKNGKEKSIDGISKPLNTANTEFMWRGNGILKLLKSKWKVLYIDEVSQWAIVYFEKTLFTPEGCGVISRTPTINAAIEQDITDKLKELGIKQKLTPIIHNQK